MRTRTFTLTTLALTAAGMLPACGAGSGDEPLDRFGASLEEATSIERCGVDGRIAYDKSCAELQRECTGDFSCADEAASQDGSCSTWGECTTAVPAGDDGGDVADGGGETAAPGATKYPNIVLKRGAMGDDAGVECEMTYGPVLKVKPQGLAADGSEGEEGEEGVTYGPVITIKPKGFSADNGGYECSIRSGDIVLKRGFEGPAADVGLECDVTYGPVLKVKPQGVADDGREGEEGVTYGPVITIKPKGLSEDEEGYACPVRYGDVTLKRGVIGAGAEVELECNTTYGPVLKIKPKG